VFYPDKPNAVASATRLATPTAPPVPAVQQPGSKDPTAADLLRDLRRSRIRRRLWIGMAAAQAIYLVTIVFWTTMYVGGWYTVTIDAWASLSIHAMNSVMATLEILLPTTRPFRLDAPALPDSHLVAVSWPSVPVVRVWRVLGVLAAYTETIVVIFVVVRYVI